MKTQRLTNTLLTLLFAATAAAVSSTATAAEPPAAASAPTPETVRVIAPSQSIDVAPPEIAIDLKTIAEGLQRELAEDIARELDQQAVPRIELVMAEVPTRG